MAATNGFGHPPPPPPPSTASLTRARSHTATNYSMARVSLYFLLHPESTCHPDRKPQNGEAAHKIPQNLQWTSDQPSHQQRRSAIFLLPLRSGPRCARSAQRWRLWIGIVRSAFAEDRTGTGLEVKVGCWSWTSLARGHFPRAFDTALEHLFLINEAFLRRLRMLGHA